MTTFVGLLVPRRKRGHMIEPRSYYAIRMGEILGCLFYVSLFAPHGNIPTFHFAKKRQMSPFFFSSVIIPFVKWERYRFFFQAKCRRRRFIGGKMSLSIFRHLPLVAVTDDEPHPFV